MRKITGSSQREITTLKEIDELLKFDEALWTAISVDIQSMNTDKTLLTYLDSDSNGYILCFEVKRAIEFSKNLLINRDGILKGDDKLVLDNINESENTGKIILSTAKGILGKLNTEDQSKITLNKIRKVKTDLINNPISELGIVLATAAKGDNLQNFITDIITTIGGVEHPGGGKGITKDKLDLFITSITNYLNWYDLGKIEKGTETTKIKPFGVETEKLFQVFSCIESRINQYFDLCRLIAIDPMYQKISKAPFEETTQTLDLSDSDSVKTFLEKLPIAKPREDRTLHYSDCQNHYYKEKLDSFRISISDPLSLQKDEILSENQWQKIKTVFTPYKEWFEGKEEESVSTLGISKLIEYKNGTYFDEVEKLIANSKETAMSLDKISNLEKLVLIQKHLLLFINNFVSFPYLYEKDKRALFERGSLILDGRRFTLCLQVNNLIKHKELAKDSNIYIIYAKIIISGDSPEFLIAAPVTSGRKKNLYIGKSGVFQSIDGKESEARIIDILENPISLSEAVSLPFRRLSKSFKKKIEETSTSAQDKFSNLTPEGQTAAVPTPQPLRLGIGGLLTGGSIAIAALGSSMAFITSTLAQLQWYTVLGTLLGVILAVMLPTFLSAFLKLRNRNLSPILEASGFSINKAMNLTSYQAAYFTQRPKMFKNAKRIMRILAIVVLIVIIGSIVAGFITGIIPNYFKNLQSE